MKIVTQKKDEKSSHSTGLYVKDNFLTLFQRFHYIYLFTIFRKQTVITNLVSIILVYILQNLSILHSFLNLVNTKIVHYKCIKIYLQNKMYLSNNNSNHD